MINRPLEMAVEGGRKGCFVFPSHSCSHRSHSSLGVSLAPEVLSVTLSCTRERWLSPWARLGVARRGDGRLLCLPLAAAFGQAFRLGLSPAGAAPWKEAGSLPHGVSSPPGPGRAEDRGPGRSRHRTHSEAQPRSWLTQCTQDAVVVEL